METKFVFAISMVSAAFWIGLCQAGGDNLFGLDYKKTLTLEDLESQLSDFYKPNGQVVANLLAISKNKKKALAGSDGLTINELIKLMTVGKKFPQFKECKRDQFEQFEDICKRLSGNVYLLNYCKYCIETRFDRCASQAGHMIKWIATRSSRLKKYSDKISKYMNGLDGKSLETGVLSFVDTLSDQKREELIELCAEFERNIMENVNFLDKNGLYTSYYLSHWNDKDESKLYEHCNIVSQLHVSEEE